MKTIVAQRGAPTHRGACASPHDKSREESRLGGHECPRHVRPFSHLVAQASACGFLLAAAASGLQWGAISSGVRLGIGAGPATPQPTLRLVFENVAAPEVRIPLGGATAKGPLYNVLFRVTSPQGRELPLFNMNGPTGRIKTQPLIADLKRGQTYEILLPMSKLVALDDGRNRTLTDLLAAHYSVRAVLDTTGNPREVTSFALWAGDLSSGEYRR